MGTTSKRSIEEGAADAFGRGLLDVAPGIMRLEANRLAGLSIPLTHRQYRILQRVGEGATSSTVISQRANVSLAAISESVDALSRRNLILREQDADDRRANRLALTREGRRALKRAERALDELSAELTRGLSPQVVTQAGRVLDQVVDNVAVQNEAMRKARNSGRG